MLSGKRGTGKTSLLLSLQYLLRPGLDEQSLTASRLPVEEWAVVRELSRRAVWLETLDLEPLPIRSSLFAAILARVEDVVREEHGDWAGFDNLTIAQNRSGMEKAIFEFDRLANDVAYAWEDGPDHFPQAFMEPESYARDARRAEQSRLSIRRRLDEVLNLFATNIKWKNEVKNPIFILPIDDFDLNPRRSLELLRLLRGIGTSRLFPLVLGDVEVARLVLDLKMQGELGSVLKGSRLSEEQLAELGRESKGLATEAIRKLLPPDQRLYLEKLSLEETLNFVPTPADYVGDPKQQTLSDLLETIHLADDEPNATSIYNLLDLDVRRWPAGGILYSGWLALRGTAREATDLWLGLVRIAGRTNRNNSTGKGVRAKKSSSPAKITGKVEELFWQQLYSCLRGEELLKEEQRRELKRDDLDSLRRFPPFPIEITPKTAALQVRTEAFPPVDLRVHLYDRLSIKPADSTFDAGEVEFEDKTRHSFVLVHDLLAVSKYPLERLPVMPSPSDLVLVEVDWKLGKEVMPVIWQTPRFKTFIDLERFGAWWNQAATQACSKEFQLRSLAALAVCWLKAGFANASQTPETWKLFADFCSHPLDDFDEDMLRKEIVALFQKARPMISPKSPARPASARRRIGSVAPQQSARYIDWLLDVAVLISPERGIPSWIAEAVISSEWPMSIWYQHAETIARRRAELYRPTCDRLANILLDPWSFERRCVLILDQSSNFLSAVSNRPAAGDGSVLQEMQSSALGIADIKESLRTFNAAFLNRGTERSAGTFKKTLESTKEILRRAIGQLRSYESPEKAAEFFQDRSISGILRVLSSCFEVVEMLGNSNQLINQSKEHLINNNKSISGHPFCPNLPVSDSLV